MNLFTSGLSKSAPRAGDPPGAAAPTPEPVPARGRTGARRPSRLLGAAALAGLVALPALSLPAGAAPGSVAATQAQAAAVAARLNALDSQMARQDEQLDQAQTRLNGLDAQLTAARQALAAAQAELADKRATLKSAAVAAYVQGGQTDGLVQLIQSSQAQADLRQSYLASVADSQQGAIDSFHAALLAFQARQARLTSEQAAAQSALAQVRAARNASAAAAAAEQSQLSSIKGHLADLVAQVEQQQAAAAAASWSGGGAASRSASFSSGGNLPPPSGPAASVAVQWAQREIGKPYVYGAAGPDSFDCSGLTTYVWGQAGRGLPHSAAGQWDDTTRVPVSALQPGDLVFYYQPVDHVGIYVGGGEMIIADHTGTNVRYASIFRSGLDGGGRVG